MCFHKWNKTVHQVEVTIESVFKSINGSKEDAILVVKKCTKCGKAKGYVKTMTGMKQKIDSKFLSAM